MTAPLLNLPITSPVAGAPGAKAAGQSPAAGFEALLSALFGAAKMEGAAPLPAGQPPIEGAPPTDAAVVAPAVIVAKPEDLISETEPAPAQDQASTPADALLLALSPQPAPLQDATQPKDTGQVAGPSARTATAPPVELTPPAREQAIPAPVAGEAASAMEPAMTAAAGKADQPAAAPAPNPKPTTDASRGLPEVVAEPATPQAPPPVQAAAAIPVAPVPTAPPPQAALVQASMEPLAPVEAEPEPAEPAEAAPATPTRKAQSAGNTSLAAHAERMPTEAPVAATAGKTAVAAESAAKPAAAVQPDAQGEAEPALDAPDAPQTAAAPPAPVQTQAAAHSAAPVRATAETVASLTAHISKSLEGRTTKFDVELNPAGLGQVNVSVEIAASGKMTAAMSFDSPQAAAELRARSHELQKALEQAGFDVSAGGLSFDVAGDRGGDGRHLAQQQQDQNDGAAWRGRAFQAVLGTAGEVVETAASAAMQYARRTDSGVDIRI